MDAQRAAAAAAGLTPSLSFNCASLRSDSSDTLALALAPPVGAMRTSVSMSYSPAKLAACQDRITRFATGPSHYNNLEAPVSVLDGRKRSSSVGQSTLQRYRHCTPATTPDKPVAPRLDQAKDVHHQPQPTSSTRKMTDCAPMQTCTNMVIHSGPLQVFVFKQTNVTVLTRQAKHPQLRLSHAAASFDGATETQAKAKTSPRHVSDNSTGLSALVQNLLRRISPVTNERKTRLRRKTTAVVFTPHPNKSPGEDCVRTSTQTSRPTSLKRNADGNTQDASCDCPLPRDAKTAPCKRKLVKSHLVYGGSLDDAQSPELEPEPEPDPAMRCNRVMSCSCNADGLLGKPSKSILERLRKARGQGCSAGENAHKQAVQTNSTNSSALTEPSSAPSGNQKSQRSERVSTTSTSKSRGVFSSSRSSQRLMSSTGTAGYSTTSITSDRISSEVSSGAIADIEESATEESEIFVGKHSPNANAPIPINSYAQRSFSVHSGSGSSRRTARLQLSTPTDPLEVSGVPSSSESEQQERTVFYKSRYRSPLRHRVTPNSEALPELNERETREAPMSPEMHKAIKLSLTAFGYSLRPYSVQRALKSLDDLRSPNLSPLQSPTCCVKPPFVTSSRNFTISQLLSSSKHDSLKRISSQSKFSNKHKIRRTSSF